MRENIIKDFYIEECCSCGVDFAMPLSLNKNVRKTKASFYCPNGHGQSYTKSTADINQEKYEASVRLNTDLTKEINHLKKLINKKKK